MKIRMTSLGLPAALLAASLFGACSNTAKGIQEDTAQNAAKANDASAEAAAATKDAVADAADATKAGLEKAAEATKDATHDAAVATRNASAAVEEKTKAAAKSTANAVDGAEQTIQIKTALIADKSVDATGIDVDTNGTTKTVTLKGHVPTAAQKAMAARIAKSKAPDYAVVNSLTIG